MGFKGASYLTLALLTLAADRGTASWVSSSRWGMRGYKQLGEQQCGIGTRLCAAVTSAAVLLAERG